MGTAIEWTDETWNPTTGCTKVSPGCDHCYAETLHERFHGKGSFATVTLHPERLERPFHWRRPRRVFVNSMSDLFHANVPVSFIADVFTTMDQTPQHTYQILTKRHGRMRSLLSHWADEGWRPPSNVWLGVSVENQHWADIRIPALLDTPAAVRFLSCEPLLGPVSLAKWTTGLPVYCGCGDNWGVGCCAGCMLPDRSPLDWVIVGGESGPNARPMEPDWARLLRDQCASSLVAFFFKQWGGRTPKANGRLLDGRTWDEYPDLLVAS